MKKIQIIGGIILFAFVAIFAANFYANKKVEAEITKYLEKTKPYMSVEYGSISTSILTRSVTVKDITVTPTEGNGDAAAKIDKITVTGLELDNKIPEKLDCTVEGYSLDQSALETGDFKIISELGYSNPKANLHLAFSYDKNSGTVGYDDISLQLENAGTLSFSISFTNFMIDENKFQNLTTLSSKTSDEINQEIISNQDLFNVFKEGYSYEDVTLKSMSISYKDESLVNKIIAKQADDSGMELDAYRLQMSGMINMMLAMQMQDKFSEEMAKTLTDFINDPDVLTISADPIKNISIKELIENQNTNELIDQLNFKLKS